MIPHLDVKLQPSVLKPHHKLYDMELFSDQKMILMNKTEWFRSDNVSDVIHRLMWCATYS